MNILPLSNPKTYLLALVLGAALHLTAMETAQDMAAGRLLDCITVPSCTQFAPPSILEQVLGFRLNLGQIRMNRFVEQFLREQKEAQK